MSGRPAGPPRIRLAPVLVGLVPLLGVAAAVLVWVAHLERGHRLAAELATSLQTLDRFAARAAAELDGSSDGR